MHFNLSACIDLTTLTQSTAESASVDGDQLLLRAPGTNLDATTFYPNDSIATTENLITIILGRASYQANDSGPAIDLSAEKINQLFSAQGEAFFARLRGQFICLIVEKKETKLFLAIDRFAIGQVYYTINENKCHLATDLKRLRQQSNKPPQLSSQSIFDYCYFHMIPSPQSIYSGVEKLPPAHFLCLSDRQPVLKRYWVPKFNEDANINAQDLHNILEQSVSRHMENDKTAAFLSGGLDSSAVCGYAQARSKNALPAYVIGFEQQGYDEVHFAQAAADTFGLDLRSHYINIEELISALDIMSEHTDEPFGNSSVVPTYLCTKLAANDGMSVMLAGDGGDELFAGNERYLKQRYFEPFTKLPKLLQTLLVSSSRWYQSMPAIKKLASYFQQAQLTLPDRLQTYNLLERMALETIFTPDFLAQVDVLAAKNHLRNVYQQSEGEATLNRLLALDWRMTLADNDLRKVSQAAAANGIDVRYPMLEDDLVALSCHIPVKQKIKGQALRYFYKESLRGWLPDLVIDKEKHGFGLPFGEWLKQSAALQDFTGHHLNQLKKRGIIRDSYIDELSRAHQQEHAKFYGGMLWVLVALELWLGKNGHSA